MFFVVTVTIVLEGEPSILVDDDGIIVRGNLNDVVIVFEGEIIKMVVGEIFSIGLDLHQVGSTFLCVRSVVAQHSQED